MVNAPVYNHAEPSNNVWAPLTKRSDIIIANRLEDKLKKVTDKAYTRDLFARD